VNAVPAAPAASSGRRAGTAAVALGALSRAAALDLASYRPEHVEERVRRALQREEVGDVAALTGLLGRDAGARERFRRSVAVSVSGVFRDREQFDLLERDVVPTLASRPGRLAVWSAGCADGSELYSLAVVLDRLSLLDRSILLGSDVLDENLAAARRGRYDGVSISPRLRERIRFERRDIVSDGPPRGTWRLVLCRNVAIYLAPAARDALHRVLAAALSFDGVLMLGRSERLSDPAALGLRRIAPQTYARSA
jgi:chemotaxis protein methyltransferase CheR